VTVVVGTAGHIDHGKTALLQALTGIDADRLPEERRRGMTIDLGYAYMALADGAELDFVDVPGHDRLVGNMLVGAGEIDATMLVVAADAGVSAQTREHLGLLDALGIADGLVALTKLDLLALDDPRREARPAQIRALLAGTTLEDSPVIGASARSGEGLDALRAALEALRAQVASGVAQADPGARLAVDRAFRVQGRGLVVTGTLRGGPIERGDRLRVEPSGRTVRVREIQVHSRSVVRAEGGGRIALNLAGVEREEVSRGVVLCTGPAVRATVRLLVSLRLVRGGRPLRDGSDLHLHLGTDEVPCRVRLAGALTADAPLAVLTLARPVAAALDDRFVLRWPSPAETAAGGRILDPLPARRLVRRRPDRAVAGLLAERGSASERLGALVAAHGALGRDAVAAYKAALGMLADPDLAEKTGPVKASHLLLDPSLASAIDDDLLRTARAQEDAEPSGQGTSLATLRTLASGMLRRTATLAAPEAASAGDAIVARLIGDGRLERDGDAVHVPGQRPDLPTTTRAAMDRLVAALRTAMPPDLAAASREAGCPPAGLRALETEGRIVRVGADLAFAAETWAGLEALAMGLAIGGPLTPAAFRDASGTSRKYALAVLEELDGRGLLRRGPDGHRLGPRAPRPDGGPASGA
jgi:selenocysteine-specific elongation factor